MTISFDANRFTFTDHYISSYPNKRGLVYANGVMQSTFILSGTYLLQDGDAYDENIDNDALHHFMADNMVCCNSANPQLTFDFDITKDSNAFLHDLDNDDTVPAPGFTYNEGSKTLTFRLLPVFITPSPLLSETCQIVAKIGDVVASASMAVTLVTEIYAPSPESFQLTSRKLLRKPNDGMLEVWVLDYQDYEKVRLIKFTDLTYSTAGQDNTDNGGLPLYGKENINCIAGFTGWDDYKIAAIYAPAFHGKSEYHWPVHFGSPGDNFDSGSSWYSDITLTSSHNAPGWPSEDISQEELTAYVKTGIPIVCVKCNDGPHFVNYISEVDSTSVYINHQNLGGFIFQDNTGNLTEIKFNWNANNWDKGNYILISTISVRNN